MYKTKKTHPFCFIVDDYLCTFFRPWLIGPKQVKDFTNKNIQDVSWIIKKGLHQQHIFWTPWGNTNS